MADREHSPTQGPGVPGESQDPATIGNRPATGARVVEHATAMPGSFGGGAEATDFLGLSQEITGMDAGFAPPTGMPGGRTHPGEYPTEPVNSPSWLLQSGRIEGAEEAQADAEAEEHEDAPVEAAKRPISVWAKIAALLLVGGGATFGYRLWMSTQTDDVVDVPPPTVVHAPKPTPTTDGATKPDGSLSDPEFRPLTDSGTGTSTTPEIGAGDPAPTGDEVADTATPRAGSERLADWVEKNPSGGVLTSLLAFGHGASTGALPAAGDVATDAGPAELAPAPTKDPSLRRAPPHGEATPAKSPVGSLRLATPEELAGIWPGDTIPMDALDGDIRLLTPGVGQVHVIMKTGDIFDGRLYAIGTGQVWLESAIGRLALDGRRVGTISLVTMEEEDGKKVEDLPRMRVRTPGGIFFGKVISHEGDRVTLLTEDGGKITLVSRDVEPAPLGDTRVVGRVEKQP